MVSPVAHTVTVFPRLSVADLNMDGKPDLAGMSNFQNRVPILLGNGVGGFSTIPSANVSLPSNGSAGPLPGDFDGNGKTDLAMNSPGTAPGVNLTLLLGNGAGGFTTVATAAPAGIFPATADFNNDGFADVVAAAGSTEISILLNTCGAAPTTTTVSSSPNPSASTQSVTITAAVAPVSGAGTPTGSVQFKDGSTNLGAVQTLSGGAATLTLSTLSEGSRSLTAVYSGDSSFRTSTSPASIHTVQGRLTINDPTTNSALGAGNMSFTVTLSTASTGTVTAAYATADRTAKAGTDYTTTTGAVTFNPGQTTRTISVPILGQTTPSSSKDFFLTLTNPTNATITKGAGIRPSLHLWTTDEIEKTFLSTQRPWINEGIVGYVIP